MIDVRLRLTSQQHRALCHHLLPSDGKEAVAIALCGRTASLNREVLLVHKVVPVPHDACKRYRDRVDWPPPLIEEVLREASQKALAILKLHSHPGGLDAFSATDDESDRRLFQSVYGWIDGDRPHLSAIMLPDGRIRARAVFVNGRFSPVSHVQVVGDDILVWPWTAGHAIPEFAERHAQLFGPATTAKLSRLRIAVVGCSGTGSPVIEQLVRLGVGELVLVDPDRVEVRNLNRILGATAKDARESRLKVHVLKDHIDQIGLGTRVHDFPVSLGDHDAMSAVAASDLVVGCMDGVSGRHLLSRVARYCLLPYVDVGVKIETLEDGTINQVAGSIHYLQPTGLDFIDRGVFTLGAVEAEDLLRADPVEYRERHARGYIQGVLVDRPAVISVNMHFASLAVNEVLARLHPFRMDSNEEFATTRVSLSHFHYLNVADQLAPPRVVASVGRGDTEPPLEMPSLGPHN